jgi:RNA polymerase subunit RPABC4/transcription elongation factor Spt4
VRPPDYLEDERERQLEIKAAEARLKTLESRTCRNCGAVVEPSYLRCPSCTRKLREPCRECKKPLDPRWKICPYCEAEVPEPPSESARARERRRAERRAGQEQEQVLPS